MSIRRMSRLVWFGALGGALAWAAQFVVAMQLGLARCESRVGRFQVPVHAWAIGLAAAAVLVAVLAELAALAVYRATRNLEQPPSARRIHFLAEVGLAVNPLVLTIAVMDGVGVPLLSLCHQS